jgi:ice-binding like protein
MRRNRQRSLVLGLATPGLAIPGLAIPGLAILGLAILGMLTLAPLTLGQSSSAPPAGIPVPTDWSHRHVIFSRPATTEQAAQIEKDPRYWQQRYRSQLPFMLPAAANGDALAHPLPVASKRERESRNRKLHRDWAVTLGSAASSGADNFPATFQTVRNTASCGSAAQPDFVIYNTGLVGSSTQASIVAYDNLYSGCSDLNLATAASFAVLGSSTVTNTGNSVVTGANIGVSPGTSLTGFPPGVLTAPAVEHLGDAVASQAQADANTAYTHYQGLTGGVGITSLDGQTLTPGLYSAGSSLALSAGSTVTLNGAGDYIFQIGSTLNIAGTVVLSGGATAGNVIWLVGSSATLPGTAVAAGNIVAQASITLDSGASLTGRAIALAGAVTMIDNAVTTVDTIPSVYWAYNTGGQILTSPVYSLDGSQVAFVQTNGGNEGAIVLLKWAPSTTESVGSPQTLTAVGRGAYERCASPPCMTARFLTGSSGVINNDTTSSVFYDYGSDTAYVGDALGWLHKFTPFFNAAPAEIRTGGWPVHVNADAPLDSPVYDFISGNVFVGDATGFLYRVNSSTASVTTSGQLDFGAGLVEGPTVNPTLGLVYVFASSDGGADCPINVGGTPCAGVYQLGTSFTGGDIGSEAEVGTSVPSGTPNPLYGGDFDNNYRTSVNGTGSLYVCGDTGLAPTLYRVPITAGTMGEVVPGPALSTDDTACSPVTDIFNPNAAGGATEWIFASVQTGGESSACAAAGCVMNFKNTSWLPSNLYSVGQEILDTGLHIEVVESTTGPSGLTVPTWNGATGGTTPDGGVTWLDQGPSTAVTPGAWVADHTYTTGNEVLDSNNNIERATVHNGISGASPPTWNTAVGGSTTDGAQKWTNFGSIATAALRANGGTSGIVIDNTLETLTGASQVYFSTLSNQTCSTSGTSGGCAVQASQSALQ